MKKQHECLTLCAMGFFLIGIIAGCSSTPEIPQSGLGSGQPSGNAVTMQRNTDGSPSKAGPDEKLMHYDLNHDNKPDVWAYFGTLKNPDNPKEIKNEALRHKEWDFNFDSKVDICRYFDFTGVAIKDEMDLDFDGHIDVITHYNEGKKIRQEYDYNFDNTPDFWKYFEKDVLVRTERDRDFNGRIDQWEYFIGGKLDRIGLDEDGDSQIDKWIQEDIVE